MHEFELKVVIVNTILITLSPLYILHIETKQDQKRRDDTCLFCLIGSLRKAKDEEEGPMYYVWQCSRMGYTNIFL